LGRIQLKPRSSATDGRAAGAGGGSGHAGGSSRGGNPFGNAIPREETLARRGIDAKAVDQKFEARAAAAHRQQSRLTAAQQAQLQAVRDDLTRITEELRDANERELPEETFRVAEERKRKELNDLLAEFEKVNLATAAAAPSPSSAAAKSPTSERPRRYNANSSGSGRGPHHGPSSGRQPQRGGGKEDKGDDPAFASFSSNRRRGGGGGGGGRNEEEDYE
jgi:Plant specific eukaryotic initiation factor 4B